MRKKEIPIVLSSKYSLFQKQFNGLQHPLRRAVKTLVVGSEYASRHIDILTQLLADDDCLEPLYFDDYERLLKPIADLPLHSFMSNLRQLRHRFFLRIALRELSGKADTEETMLSWSDCAEAIIIQALQFCMSELKARYGQPCDTEGKSTDFFILAMGKLGGRELNFSSDIDLIFVFSATGFTTGSEVVSNQAFYTKVVQLFIQIMQQVTSEGMVFRVDLRLRPHGESGALVCSLAAIEDYYQEQGRDWERYAMVKARLLGKELLPNGHWLQRIITPFVYRRYVDFSVIESLRSMKAMIEREVQLNPQLNDIKRGMGGIREIEFIIQNFQLIHGGRLIQLRRQSTLSALTALKETNLLLTTSKLKKAYLFLRKLENALQLQNDQQIHSLPKDNFKQMQIALLMGYSQWENLIHQLEYCQHRVSKTFRTVLSQTSIYDDSQRLLVYQLSTLWQGHIETGMAINVLTGLGYQHAERCYQMLYAFRHGPRCRRLSQVARLRLDRFMVFLLIELIHISKTDEVLLEVLRLLENIVGRSAYLALLTENPAVIKELLHWLARSPFISSLLINYPFLLEILLDQNEQWQIPSRRQLAKQLKKQLATVSESELKNDLMRKFKLNYWLLAARAELDGQYDALEIGRFLSNLAEIILTEVFAIACCELEERYPNIKDIETDFAIIAYGKLGSGEMNYNSDLDLVFIHSASSQEEVIINRLTQKILHMLTTRSHAGILYTVDTRLRPSGAAGLLVSPLDAFIDYQCTQAWLWEHQALLRARVVYGSKAVKRDFQQLKSGVLRLPRHLYSLWQEIWTMRKKINRYDDENQAKYSEGGLMDLEFLVQYLLLAFAKSSLVSETNTLSFLEGLLKKNILSTFQFNYLKKAYKYYHTAMHQNLLTAKKVDFAKAQRAVRVVIRSFQKNLLHP